MLTYLTRAREKHLSSRMLSVEGILFNSSKSFSINLDFGREQKGLNLPASGEWEYNLKSSYCLIEPISKPHIPIWGGGGGN